MESLMGDNLIDDIILLWHVWYNLCSVVHVSNGNLTMVVLGN